MTQNLYPVLYPYVGNGRPRQTAERVGPFDRRPVLHTARVSYASVQIEENQIGKNKNSLTGTFVNITSSQQNPPPAGHRSLVSDNPSATTDPRQIGNNQYHGEVKGNETNEDTNIPAAVTIAIVILGILKVTVSQSIDPSH